MEDPAFKAKYQKYKTKVKLWEKQFREKNGRVPSKHDIREAPTTIRDSYKMYYKLKTSFLEEAFSDTFDEDSFDLSILESSNSQTESRLSTSFSEISTPDVSALTSDTSIILQNISIETLHTTTDTVQLNRSTVDRNEFVAEGVNSVNDNAWARTSKSESKSSISPGSKLRKSMSDKLFRNSSFQKRNPRKSLSRNSLSSNTSSQSLLSSSQKESFPDLETILSQKSKQQKDTEESTESMPSNEVTKTTTSTNLINNIDQEWLNRCNKANNIEAVDSNGAIADAAILNESRSKTTEQTKTFGLSNINANALALYERSQPAQEVGAKSMLSFDMNNLNLTSQNSFGGSSSAMIADPIDDEEIANSEDEADMNTSRQIRSIRTSFKRKHNEIDRELPTKVPAKIDCIEQDVREKPIPLAVKRTKSMKKVAPTPKPEQQLKPTVVASKDATVPIVRRKSSRNKPSFTYKEVKMDDSKSEESDPFAGDDSDKDPNFSEAQETKSKTKILTDSSDDDEKQTKNETTIKKETTQKTRISRVKSSVAKPRAKVERKTRVASKKKQARPVHHSSDSEAEAIQETPDDYLPEFGMETIKSVPRIPVAELQKNSIEFTKYVYSADANVNVNEATNKAGSSKPKPLSTKNAIARDKLATKIAAGSLNENYVRLNLRKKVFVRGKKTMNFSKYKKKLWKTQKAAALSGPEMDMRGCDGGILTCFQCGLPGHFAQNCKAKSDRLLPLTVEEDSPFPTLQEVEEMSNQQIKLAHVHRELPQINNPTWKNESEDATTEVTDDPTQSDIENDESNPEEQPTQSYIGHKIPEDFLIKAGLIGNDAAEDKTKVEPLYKLNADGSTCNTPHEVYDALALFGHKEFRSGQEKAVMRILSGQSTLVTLSTGSGKSLCYQLPAYMYSRRKRCITLVISPLVSLMEDQVQGVPHFLNAQCLHTNLSEQKRATTIELIKTGQVDVLLISPEAVVSSEKSTGFGSILRHLPPVAFVCIDECHCVSQFGHNFRPSYLMVCRVLYEKLKIKTVLGLTATATLTTRLSIVEHLRIPDGLDGVISDIPLPDNLTLSISSDENRDYALVQLLKQPRFVEFQSIIIYCSRRDECERVAKNLRTYFQDNIARELELRNASGKRKRTLKTTIEPYHAGMAASRRRTIQNAFMRGDLKIVVATIAFGMGINKADIRCVIHYNMPMNFESYVQEVGRAGRDGKPAHCHLFLDSKGEDKVELRRHIYANSIDRHIIRKLLHKIFKPCACKKSEETTVKSNVKDAIQSDIDAIQGINWNDEVNEGSSGSTKQRDCPGHEICFSVDETINELDIPEENISTLLCYLELHDQRYVKALSKAYIRCKVLSYGGPKALKNAALKCPPLAMAIALDIRKGISHDTSTFIEFPVIEIASAIGWNSGVVKYQLKQLEWSTENGVSRRSNISVEFSDLGFRVTAPGDLSPTELDSTLDMLFSRVKEQENNQVNQLENVFHGLSSVAVKSALACSAVEPNNERSEQLKRIVRKYFQSNEKIDFTEQITEPVADSSMDDIIISDIYTMISRYPENQFTGRSLARIFHGVQSPVFPAVIWSRCKHWRAHLKTDFNHIVKLANAVILKLRT